MSEYIKPRHIYRSAQCTAPTITTAEITPAYVQGKE
jgi:hypothetical protein